MSGRIFTIKTVICACLSAVMLIAASGCTSLVQQNEEAKEQAANRQYMSQVNQTIDDFSAKLEAFETAVSTSDVVSMRTTADSAFKVLDSLSALEVPEVLKDVQSGYTKGCSKLREALQAYLDIYRQVENGALSVESADYTQKLQAAQKLYDEGIAALKSTDELASQL